METTKSRCCSSICAIVGLCLAFVELSAASTSGINAYADPISVAAGQTVDFKISADGEVTIHISRLSGLDQHLLSTPPIRATIQERTAEAYENGAKWKKTFTLKIPSIWRSGIYSARITNGHFDTDVRFIVKPPIGQSKLMFLVGTNTWQAYNPWGGGGFYDGPKDGASYDRPIEWRVGNFRQHTIESDRWLIAWLDTQGYDYSVATDLDLHIQRDKLFAPVGTLIIGAHSEYWTESMRSSLVHFIGRGGNLLYLGANAITSHVEFQPNTKNMYFAINNPKALEHGEWWRNQLKPQPESEILGIQYEQIPDKTHCAPYVVKESQLDHWAFKGTQLTKGSAFGLGGRIDHAWCDTGAASGWEADRCPVAACGKNALVLAESIVPSQMVFVQGQNSEGSVFSAGSIHFIGSLVGCENEECINDHVLSQVVTNVLEHFGNKRQRA